MGTASTTAAKHPTDYLFRRITVDPTREEIRQEAVACRDRDNFLGGIARSFRLLAEYEVHDAFAPPSPLIMNLGVFSGTELITGRTTASRPGCGGC